MSDKEIHIPIKMGMLGMSLEEIAAGKQGWVKLPLGVRDPTSWGGREWIRVKVTAYETVRATRDIIVANEQGEVKEHTPAEISYEKAEGGYERVGENYPLPTGGGAAEPFYKQATASGPTEVLTLADKTKQLVIKVLMVFNSGAAAITVYLRDGSTGTARFQATLAANTGYALNLTGAHWKLTAGNSLYINLSAAGTVDISGLKNEI